MSELAQTIDLLQARRGTDLPAETAEFILTYTRLLAEGKPVSAKALGKVLDEPEEFMTTAFLQMQQSGAEFNEKGDLIGAALTLTPTRHQFEINGNKMFAWCALDTLFLPAYIGQTAQVTSTCPITDSTISVTITPEKIEHFAPDEIALSIMTGKDCSSGIEGTFCSQIHFFASSDAARKWVGDSTDFAILTLSEAYQLAQAIYIEPMLKHS